MEVEIVGVSLEIISCVIFLAVVFYMFKIKRKTRGLEQVQNLIAAGFLLLVIKRLIAFYALSIDKIAVLPFSSLTNPALSLIMAFLFFMAAYKFNKLCDKAPKNK